MKEYVHILEYKQLTEELGNVQAAMVNVGKGTIKPPPTTTIVGDAVDPKAIAKKQAQLEKMLESQRNFYEKLKLQAEQTMI